MSINFSWFSHGVPADVHRIEEARKVPTELRALPVFCREPLVACGEGLDDFSGSGFMAIGGCLGHWVCGRLATFLRC